MKFKVVKSKLIEGLKSVQNVVSNKPQMAILQNVLIEASENRLRLTTTDLDLSMRTTVEAEVIESGLTTLPAKLLFGMIATAPEGEVQVEVDVNEQATITAGSARYKLNGKPEVEFPRMNFEESACEYTMDVAVISEMLRKTHYAASQDDTRRSLKGVLMSFKDGKLTMVATDGRRMALVENEFEFAKSNEKDIILPYKAVMELMRSLTTASGEVKIVVQQNKICFEMGEVSLYSKLIEEIYPNYAQVIPQESKEKIVIDRQLLIDALDRASVMTMNEMRSIKLIFDMNQLVVTSAANDVGEAMDKVPIKYAGEKIEIVFNPTYLKDPLKAIDDDEITICLNDGHSTAMIRCSIPFLYILMPLNI